MSATPLNPALTRYRVIAWIVGVLLIVLTVGTVLKYTTDDETIVALVGPAHGFLYMVYLVLAADLARRAKWTIGFTVLILLAGTVPFLSFVAERVVTRRVQAVSAGSAVRSTV
ncbi:membrane protein [Dactylosporangium sucinum]|uniref:Membrane protein n=1 Tax=Dactylosporangium sucinum TaxID=1424081 RepID=A0A917UC39_9ACTN|nr:membrane protein [Dactylosporangium sucinum]